MHLLKILNRNQIKLTNPSLKKKLLFYKQMVFPFWHHHAFIVFLNQLPNCSISDAIKLYILSSQNQYNQIILTLICRVFFLLCIHMLYSCIISILLQCHKILLFWFSISCLLAMNYLSQGFPYEADLSFHGSNLGQFSPLKKSSLFFDCFFTKINK